MIDDVSKLEEVLFGIAQLHFTSPFESEKMLSELVAVAKKIGISKSTILKQFHIFVSGIKDKLDLQKKAKAAAKFKVVGGTDHGDEPMPSFSTVTELRGAVADGVRKLLGQGNSVLGFGEVPVEIDFVPIPGIWQDDEQTIPAIFARPVPLDTSRAVRHIERVCRWTFPSARMGVDVPKHVPEWCAKDIANGSVLHYRALKGVIRHPVLTPANKLLSGGTGYDSKTQFFIASFDIPGGDFEWESPQAAYRWLVDDWLGEFQFATPADAARAILIPLTMLRARTCLSSPTDSKFPGFMITAPVAASGKTELVRALTTAVMGEPAPNSIFRDDEEEMAKFLLSISIADPTCLYFDNIKNGYGLKSPSLDAFITGHTLSGRKLGANQIVNHPIHSVVIATGNNIEAVDDTSTRFVEIRLEPLEEAPQNHVYTRNVMAFTVENRARILSAMLRIACASATVMGRVGRFPEWFDICAVPVANASGETGILDKWKAPGTTIRNAEGLAAFLEKIADLQDTGGNRADGIWTADVIDEALAEYADLVGIPHSEIEEASGLFDPSDTEAQKAKITARAVAVRKRMKQGIARRLHNWKGQRAGDFRLTLIMKTNSDGKQRLKIFAKNETSEKCEKNGGADELPF